MDYKDELVFFIQQCTQETCKEIMIKIFGEKAVSNMEKNYTEKET